VHNANNHQQSNNDMHVLAFTVMWSMTMIIALGFYLSSRWRR